MRTDPALRNRYRADGITVNPAAGTLPNPKLPADSRPRGGIIGGMQRIAAGLFGVSTPRAQLSSQVAQPKKALYHYHEGDLFTPGSQNYVFEPPFELPLNTVWGHAFLRAPNTFSVLQPAPVSYIPTGTYFAVPNGIGGLVAGQMALQPLESTGE